MRKKRTIPFMKLKKLLLEKFDFGDVEMIFHSYLDVNLRSDITSILLQKTKFQSQVFLYWYADDLDSSYISNLYVDNSVRNVGIGTELINICEKISKILNMKKIYLRVDCESSWVCHWYKTIGYSSVTSEKKEFWLMKKIY